MPVLFLIPLFTGLVTAYIFKKSTDEIGQLIGVVAVISLALGLILAPWQVQLLLLVVVLVGTQKLLQQNEYKLRQQKKQQEQPNYNHSRQASSSEVQKMENEFTRKYRGVNY
ncbi:DUF4278 domain-containing protein [Fischerella sp.]|jgi:hypothetical protein|uniref:DUF4278 domain-containing protein n=1 Tax=Fischerella sp. TaxID=1191 RepID=UPI0025C408CC|nr:DUF4278 domain-containing protein [Fischerella sp.]